MRPGSPGARFGWRLRWFVLALGLWTVHAMNAGAAAAERPPPKADAELTRLRDFLVGLDRTPGTRRDAAEVLIEKDNNAARAILVEVLSGPTPSEAVLAVLDAIAARDSAHEALIDPLFKLLRSDDEATRRAAALAFGAYQGNEKVLRGLKDLAVAPDAAVPVRLAAVQALSQLMDKRAIDALVRMTQDAKSPVASAAADALADMTGIRDMGPGRDAWAEWWKRRQDDTESRLLGSLLRRFREEGKRREATLERIQTRLIRQLSDAYEAADVREKGRLALTQIEDPVPQVRALAARQAAAMARSVLGAGNGEARKPYQELVAALLKHLSDDSPTVRAAAAEALAAWQEAVAGPVLLARLDTEKVPEARAAAAAALGALKVAEAVPKLVAVLDSSSEIEVIRAAGALGLIGEKNAASPIPVKAAVEPLGRLARSASQPAVREAACLALAKIAPPSAEEILSAALEDPTPSVRFGAAQGLGNLGKVGEKTIAALSARLQDENKGVRQAVAAALAKVDGPEAASKMADRLKAGAETEPAVRTALWEAIRALADRATAPDAAQELGDRFFGREGAEDMQRAAAMYEAALSKIPAASRSSAPAQVLYEKLVDAYVAAGTPDNAVPPLRQLLIITPPDKKVRIRELNQQLGLILLAKDPAAEAAVPLVAAMEGADATSRLALAKAILTRAEALLKADKPDQAVELLDGVAHLRPEYGGAELTDSITKVRGRAAAAAAAAAIGKLGGTEEQAAAATATLKRIGRSSVPRLLDALEVAAKNNQAAQETRLLAALEAVTGRKDHGYSPQASLDDRLKRIAVWRQSS
jgi:HEAT repeat protein